jgi:beta-glucosidase-like glycosyl hydrolase
MTLLVGYDLAGEGGELVLNDAGQWTWSTWRFRRVAPLLLSALASLVSMCATAPPPPLAAPAVRTIPRVEELTLDQKVGQLFSYPAHGVYMSESSPQYRALMRQVRENKVGGIIWFVSNVYETAFLNERLQAAADIPLLVSADIEAGIGMRFTDTTYWPPAMAVAATGDPALAERQGRIEARECKAIGINHILAPVADVNVDPDNPVINIRSYGEDPQEVGRYAAAIVRGVQSEGVLATPKHFPGHGDTHVNSHRSLPSLDATRERLDRVELVPFRAAIEAGAGSVMIGHLGVPAIDARPVPQRSAEAAARENVYAEAAGEAEPGGTVPATLSAAVINGILRQDLGFKGLVVADAFDMGALVNHYAAGEAAVLAIEAGENYILKSPDTDAAIAAVKAAVQSGRIPMATLNDAVSRVLDAKRRVHAGVASQEQIFRSVDTQEHRAVAAEIARKAITLVREEERALPLRRDARVVMLVVSDFPELANPLGRAERELAARLSTPPRTFVLDSRAQLGDAEPVIAAMQDADVVLLALAVRGNWAAREIATPEAARRAIAAIPQSVNTIAVSFGSPYTLRDFPHLRTYAAAYSVQPIMQVAAVEAIFGEAPITGRLPVTIPGLHPRGEGIQRAISSAR